MYEIAPLDMRPSYTKDGPCFISFLKVMLIGRVCLALQVEQITTKCWWISFTTYPPPSWSLVKGNFISSLTCCLFRLLLLLTLIISQLESSYRFNCSLNTSTRNNWLSYIWSLHWVVLTQCLALKSLSHYQAVRVKQVLRVTQADNLYEDNVCLCPLTSKCSFSQIKSILPSPLTHYY